MYAELDLNTFAKENPDYAALHPGYVFDLFCLAKAIKGANGCFYRFLD